MHPQFLLFRRPLLLSCFVLVVSLFAARGSTWYVDSSAVGSNTGGSWANAWTTISGISGVLPGDTVYISGGPSDSSRTYSLASGWRPVGGVAGNPITYQIGQDSLHNGTAIFNRTGGTAAYWVAPNNNVVISGDGGDGKRHFFITNYIQGCSIANASNVRVSYVDFGDKLSSAFDTGGATIQGLEIDHIYCKIGDMKADHFMFLNQCVGDWDSNSLHDSVILLPSGGSGIGADGLQVNGMGFSCYNNIIGSYPAAYTGGQHQDGWQSTGLASKFKFYGNVFTNIGNYALFGDGYYGGFTNIFVMNNLVVITKANNSIAPAGIVFGVDGGAMAATTTFTNVVIANNLCDGFSGHDAIALNNVSVHNGVFSNCRVANNAIVNGGTLNTQGNSTSQVYSNVFVTSANAVNYFQSYTIDSSLNDYHLLGVASGLIGKGAALSSYFNTDMDGKARPASSPWDVGPYQYGIVTNPVISIAPSTLDFGSISVGASATNTLAVKNAGGGTLTGTAAVSPPFNIVSGGSYTLGSNQSQLVTITYNPTTSATNIQNITFSGANGAMAQLIGVALSGGLNFQAADAAISSPFVLANGYISQSGQTTDPALGGSAIFNFTVTNAGDYTISATVNAPGDAANSLFVNIDAQPTSPLMIWDIPVTSEFSSRTVSWRGNGTDAAPQYLPKIFTLSSGSHQIIVRGRESGVQLSQITVVPAQARISPPSNLRVIP